MHPLSVWRIVGAGGALDGRALVAEVEVAELELEVDEEVDAEEACAGSCGPMTAPPSPSTAIGTAAVDGLLLLWLGWRLLATFAAGAAADDDAPASGAPCASPCARFCALSFVAEEARGISAFTTILPSTVCVLGGGGGSEGRDAPDTPTLPGSEEPLDFFPAAYGFTEEILVAAGAAAAAFAALSVVAIILSKGGMCVDVVLFPAKTLKLNFAPNLLRRR